MNLTCAIPQGAFYVFPNISSTGLDSESFAKQLLQEKRVAVVPGTAFGSNGENYIRCSYAVSMDDIEEAMSRISNFISNI